MKIFVLLFIFLFSFTCEASWRHYKNVSEDFYSSNQFVRDNVDGEFGICGKEKKDVGKEYFKIIALSRRGLEEGAHPHRIIFEYDSLNLVRMKVSDSINGLKFQPVPLNFYDEELNLIWTIDNPKRYVNLQKVPALLYQDVKKIRYVYLELEANR